MYIHISLVSIQNLGAHAECLKTGYTCTSQKCDINEPVILCDALCDTCYFDSVLH